MKCHGCGKEDELRLGYCWDCASAGEATAGRRTVPQHLAKMVRNLWRRNSNAKYDFKWAWERLTKTGDYASGGYFDHFNIKT